MANEFQGWKGAVEPAESSPSGNEFQGWKGAVEPAEPVAGGNPKGPLGMPLSRPIAGPIGL